MNPKPLPPLPESSEAEVRHLRANIYGECTDGNWHHTKHNWMTFENVRWLVEQNHLDQSRAQKRI